jgi:hypothetical protein
MGIMKKRKLQKNHYKKKKGEQEENRNRKIDQRIRIGDIVGVAPTKREFRTLSKFS